MNHQKPSHSRKPSMLSRFGLRHDSAETAQPRPDARKILAGVMVNGMPVTVEPVPLSQRAVDLDGLTDLHMKLVETAAQVSEIDAEEADRLRWAIVSEPQVAQAAMVKFIDTLVEHRHQN